MVQKEGHLPWIRPECPLAQHLVPHSGGSFLTCPWLQLSWLGQHWEEEVFQPLHNSFLLLCPVLPWLSPDGRYLLVHEMPSGWCSAQGCLLVSYESTFGSFISTFFALLILTVHLAICSSKSLLPSFPGVRAASTRAGLCSLLALQESPAVGSQKRTSSERRKHTNMTPASSSCSHSNNGATPHIIFICGIRKYPFNLEAWISTAPHDLSKVARVSETQTVTYL